MDNDLNDDYPKEFPAGVTEGEKEMVTEYIAACIRGAASLIEGKFMTSFEVEFETCDKRYKLSLEEIKK